MLYLIVGEDSVNSLNKRKKVRAAHLERLEALEQTGQLVLAGPLPAIDSEDPGKEGYTGSAIVARFDSLEAAQMWAAGDPYLLEGVFERISVRPFKQVFPREST